VVIRKQSCHDYHADALSEADHRGVARALMKLLSQALGAQYLSPSWYLQVVEWAPCDI